MDIPKASTVVTAIGSNNQSKCYQLYWCTYRKQFIELLTDKPAKPLIGEIIYWEYTTRFRTNLLLY